MPAFSPNFYARLEHVIRQQCSNDRNRSAVHFSRDEAKDLIIPTEMREILDQASKLVEIPRNSYFTLHLLDRSASLYGSFDFLIPKTKRDLSGAMHEPVYAKLQAATDEYIEHGLKWGRVSHLVQKLNEVCSNIKQVRAVFPGLVYLIDLMGENEKASQLRDGVKVASVPALTPEVKSLCREVTEFLAVASLLPKDNSNDGRASDEFKIMSVNVRGRENYIS